VKSPVLPGDQLPKDVVLFPDETDDYFEHSHRKRRSIEIMAEHDEVSF